MPTRRELLRRDRSLARLLDETRRELEAVRMLARVLERRELSAELSKGSGPSGDGRAPVGYARSRDRA